MGVRLIWQMFGPDGGYSMDRRDMYYTIATVVMVVSLVLLLCTGCKTQQEAVSSVTNISSDILRYSLRVDSTYRDRFVTLDRQGDTIRDWSYLYSYKFLRDTTYIYKDSIVRVTEVVTNEINRLYWWQEALMWAGVLLILVIVYKIVRLST